MPSARLELDIQDAGNPIPHQMLWICLLAPLGTTFLIKPGLLSLPADQIARAMVGMLVPFIIIPLTMFLTYQWVLPPVLARLRTPAARWTLHVGMATVFAAAVSLLVLPLHNLIC